MKKYVITYDIGTTGIKTCLIEIEDTMRILASATAGYNLYVVDETGVKGGAEQDADEWWAAMCSTTRTVFDKMPTVKKEQVEGISFCSAMQGLVLVDKEGKCIRRPMTYMDQRAREELKKGMAHGVQIAGAEVTKLLKYLKYTGAVSSSVKDPIWKYRWVEAHEPENFKKIYKWLDIKEYLILRASGEFVMTQDSAFGTLLYDTRKGHEGWCKPVCDMVGVKMEHLAPIKKSTEKVGEVTESAAKELGLAPGTAVYGGGGDASLIGVGAGATGNQCQNGSDFFHMKRPCCWKKRAEARENLLRAARHKRRVEVFPDGVEPVFFQGFGKLRGRAAVVDMELLAAYLAVGVSAGLGAAERAHLGYAQAHESAAKFSAFARGDHNRKAAEENPEGACRQDKLAVGGNVLRKRNVAACGGAHARQAYRNLRPPRLVH